VDDVQEALRAINQAHRQMIEAVVVSELPEAVPILDENGNPVVSPDGSVLEAKPQEAFLEARVKATNDLRGAHGLPTI
jgi:hypothetical protein